MKKKITIEIEVCGDTNNQRIESGFNNFIIDNFQKPETAIIKIEDIK